MAEWSADGRGTVVSARVPVCKPFANVGASRNVA